MRSYVEARLGPQILPKLYHLTDQPETIPFDNLPDKFVVKPTHGSGWVEIDPTNGIVGNRDLIRVAVARVPSQAIPLFGSYWGDREDELGMDVEVNVKTASALL